MTLVPWWAILAALLLTAIVVAAVLLSARAARRRTTQPRRPGGRTVLAAIVVGWMFIALTAVSTVFQAIAIGVGDGAVPVLTQPYWPALPMPQENIGGIAFVTGGGYTEASVQIDDLSAAARAWDIAAVVIQGAAFIAAALVVIRLCTNLRAGRGLAGTGRAFGLLAVVALLGGFAWEIAWQVGGMLAAGQVSIVTTGLESLFPEGWPQPTHQLTIDFWPVLPFLAFGALAAAFRYAERLQRDTEGLV